MEIIEFQPRQRIAFSIERPASRCASEATMELTRSGRTKPSSSYRGHLDVRHRMASRMRGLFNEIAEDQAHSLVHRVKVKAEQRRLAQERLLK